MKTLSKQDQEQLSKLLDAIHSAESAIGSIAEEFEPIIEKINEAIERYNESLTDLESFCSDTAQAISDYISDRSDAWQEGDRGQQYQQWQGAWEEFSFDQLPLVEPIEIEFDFDPEDFAPPMSVDDV